VNSITSNPFNKAHKNSKLIATQHKSTFCQNKIIIKQIKKAVNENETIGFGNGKQYCCASFAASTHQSWVAPRAALSPPPHHQATTALPL
jgi:hypothetical protein